MISLASIQMKMPLCTWRFPIASTGGVAHYGQSLDVAAQPRRAKTRAVTTICWSHERHGRCVPMWRSWDLLVTVHGCFCQATG
jgi:hypothetical protein